MTSTMVVAAPTTILVDRQGIIRTKVIGFEYYEGILSIEDFLDKTTDFGKTIWRAKC